MNGQGGNESEPDDDVEVFEESESTVVLSEDVVDEDDLESSAEINVDKLVADIERLEADTVMRKRLEARKRLDAMKEQLDEDDAFASTYNFNIDEDLPT